MLVCGRGLRPWMGCSWGYRRAGGLTCSSAQTPVLPLASWRLFVSCLLVPVPLPLPYPAQLLWAEGGVKRFYRGFTPCLIRAAPANGAMLLTVDTVTNWLNKQS